MDKLTLVIRTLNSIDVRGADNLNKLLGCIQALEAIQTEKEREHEADDKQG